MLNLHNVFRRLDSLDRASRLLAGYHARALYPCLLENMPSPPGSQLHPHEFRVYSQHGEDGILLHIFSRIGVDTKRFVEFGVEDGTECNAANLVVNFGFSGLMLDGSQENVQRGRNFYAATLGPSANRLAFQQSWITAENINAVIESNGIGGPIDLLSIDIDGNDYWVWKAVHAVDPRVVVIEYNAGFGPTRSVTIPYAPEFDRWRVHRSGFYFGASLAALEKLGSEKGYSLIGCDSSGANAFFVKRSIADGLFRTVTAREAFVPLFDRIARGHSQAEQEQLLFTFPLHTV